MPAETFFDAIAEKYMLKDILAPSSIPRRSQLLAAIKPHIRNRNLGVLVEIGCGCGFAAKYLGGRYDRYIGIDNSIEMIKIAGKQHADITNATFHCSEVNNMDKIAGLNQKADTILCVGVLHHLTSVQKCLSVLKKIAVPGAVFIAIEPNRQNPIIQFARKLRMKLDKGYSDKQAFFLPQELMLELKEAGITNIQLRFEGFFATPFSQIILKPQLIFKPASKLAVCMDKILANSLPSDMSRYSWNIIATGNF